MLANEVIYIDIDDFVSNVETLINQGIADIRERRTDTFNRLINSSLST